MNEKTLSSSPKQQVHESLSPLLSQLTKAQLATLRYLVDAATNLETIEFSQATIAEATGFDVRTTARAIAKLRQLRLIITTYRHRKSLIYTINPKFYTDVSWHNQCYYWFQRYPKFISILNRTAATVRAKIVPFALSLLLSASSGYQEKCHTIISGVGLSLKQSLLVEYPKGQKKVTEGNNVKNISPEKTTAARQVALALIKRGARLTNNEALGLMAFEDSVIRKASAVMKQRSGLQTPDRYFFGLCRKLAVENGSLLDNEIVSYMRNNGLRLLSEQEETAALQQPEVIATPSRTQKRDGDGFSYSEQVKQGQAREREAAQKRAPAKLDREAEIAQCRKDLATLEAKKEAGCPFAAMTAPIVRKMLADLEDTPVNHPLEPEAIRPATAEGAAVIATWSQLGQKRFATQPKHYNGYIFDRDED